MTTDQDMESVKDWVAETHESIAARLEGAKASQSQIRLTLAMMAIISTMMLIASYNAYSSYDYNWICEVKKDLRRDPATDILIEQALKDWASSRVIVVSLLGTRVSVDDAAVLGTVVLFLLSLWLLLLARRENHTIGFLLRDTDTPRPSRTPSGECHSKTYPSGERWLIFHTIISNSLFVTFDHSLSPVSSLDGPNPLKASNTSGLKGWMNRVGFRLVRGFFFLFPTVTAFIVFCIDRLSYDMRDPFRPDCSVPGFEAFFWRSTAISILFLVPLALCCCETSSYWRATEKVLHEYGDKLRADLTPHQQAAQNLKIGCFLFGYNARSRHLRTEANLDPKL